VREAKRLTKKLRKLAPYLRNRRSFVRRIGRSKITQKKPHPRRTIDKIKKAFKPKEKKLPPLKRVTCDLFADPHARSFNGVGFEAQTEGDWLLHEGPTLRAHYRGKRFGSWVGVTDWIVQTRGVSIRNKGFTGVTVDGKDVALAAGKPLKLEGGAIITQTGNKFNINSGNGEDVDFVAFGYFFNAYVRSSRRKVRGLCSHQFIKSHAFNHPKEGKIVRRARVNCANKKAHVKTCKAKGLVKTFLRNCVFDLCARFPRKLERKVLKWNKKENKKKPLPVTPVKRVTCDMYADPHARSFDGKLFEAQTEGDWILHRGPTLALTIVERNSDHGLESLNGSSKSKVMLSETMDSMVSKSMEKLLLFNLENHSYFQMEDLLHKSTTRSMSIPMKEKM